MRGIEAYLYLGRAGACQLKNGREKEETPATILFIKAHKTSLWLTCLLM